ncbi:efflux RND transporter permease subunit [Bythopirellula goksoeyrii]|uniref:Efflux pump membrane transporter BepE n=1 Tax=Bythopirellula goksoeyrii TaxID=1400387 RepID=A0A5B9QTA5_9BACT|nr:efflux RND transporter permease subunit [Bythopirellula goksoeyrii]QEG37341.1 Efflux pump membrane transporter BepE [Bythopirellula goksoeyrii]
MQLVESFVRNPVKISVGVLLTALFGTIALTRLPLQLTPEVDTPTITITTRWPGASPKEVEQEIIVEQEEQLKGVEGSSKLSSESSDSQGVITLEFNVGTDMDQALLKVNSRLNQVREYPEDADQPIITTANSSNSPIAWFILGLKPPSAEEIRAFAADHPAIKQELERCAQTSNPGLLLHRLRSLALEHPEVSELLPPPDLDPTKLRRFAEDEIEARFERVAGVSQSNVIGGLEDEMQIVVDPEKLAARQITLTQMRDVLRSQNKDTSAGDFYEGKRRWVVRSLGEFRTPEQVENQLLAVRDGAPVFVRDVATVHLGYKKPDGVVRRYGGSSIAVNCIRETGANVLDIMADLRVVTQELNRDILNPKGLMLGQVYDETEYINSSVNLVQENIFLGGALTMIVLMSFLHLGYRTLLVIPAILATSLAAVYLSPWWFALCLALIIGSGFWFARGALVVGLAIPISIIGTFLVLGMLGRSLNVISLAGLAFAVGMLVDNAIVVLENIYRRYSLGESPVEAAANGTEEVWGAVVSSTLTTIAVFLPVVFIQEEAGQLFRDIALAISAAVALSLLVSVTVIPTAASRLFQKRREESPRDPINNGALDNTPISPKKQVAVVRLINALGAKFNGFIVGLNRWIQGSLLRQIVTIVLLISFALGLSWQLWPRVEYLPSGNRNLVFGIILPPPGYNIDQLMSLGEIVESELQPYWDVDEDFDDSNSEVPTIADFFFVVRGRSVFLGLRAKDPLRAGEFVPLIFQVGKKLPGAIAVAKQSSLFEQGLAAGRTIDIEITGPEVEKLVQLGGQIFGQVMGMIPNVQAQPKPSLDLSSPEVHIKPRLLQAAEMQVSSSELGFTVDALVDGAYVSDYFLEGKKIDLTLKGEDKYADRTQLVGAVPIATPLGQLIPLNALADVTLASGPEQLNHRERVRAITISASPPPEMPLEEAMTIIQTQIVQPMREGNQLDGGYRIALEGTADKLRETWLALRENIIIALLITYLLMAALFESWLYPFVIILSVPLGAVGGILALHVLNYFVLQPLDVLTMLGFVVLIGTVVNNPILIVHQALNHIRLDGMTPRDAVLESVRTRIRPIFMTTTTTTLGLLPLVVFPGAGSELYRGLGSVVLGGLISSTLFTLILVPTLFTVTLSAKQLVTRGEKGEDLADEVEELPPQSAAVEDELEVGAGAN